MIRYLQNVGTLISQTAHTLLFPRTGHPDLTISARAHIEAEVYGNPNWTTARNVIDWLFFWDENHCAGSFARDVEHATQVQAYIRRLMGE